MFEWVASPEAWLAFGTLVALEIVLGIDNIIFISILVGRLPEAQRNRARTLGIAFAMLTRLGLLFSLVWIMGLVDPWFTILGQEISGRDLILILGGLFLLVLRTTDRKFRGYTSPLDRFNLLLLAALAVFAFYTSLGGKPLFGRDLLET